VAIDYVLPMSGLANTYGYSTQVKVAIPHDFPGDSRFFAQALIFDPSANSAGLLATGGLELRSDWHRSSAPFCAVMSDQLDAKSGEYLIEGNRDWLEVPVWELHGIFW
jgi:hypothetical protein